MEQFDKQSTEEREILDLEAMGFQCMKVLGRYNYLEMKKSLQMHKHHEMLEICFLEKGSQYYQIEGKDYRLRGGDLLLTFPGEEHGTKSYPEGKGRLYWLLLQVPKNKQCLLNLTKKETDILFEKLNLLGQNRKFTASQPIKNDLNRIFKLYYAEGSFFKKIQITNLLLNFLLNVIEYGEKSTDNFLSDEIRQVCEYVDQNLNTQLGLEVLAYRANLSLSHFKFRFKKEMGIPPTDYILRKKIDRAKNMLHKELAVKDVAYDLAFSSPSYFATVFKRYTGETPSMFIQKGKVHIG